MLATLVGLPSEFDPNEGLQPINLGEVVIRATGEDLRALAAHMLVAAAAIEAGRQSFESFSFRDARPPRNTPSQVMFQAR